MLRPDLAFVRSPYDTFSISSQEALLQINFLFTRANHHHCTTKSFPDSVESIFTLWRSYTSTFDNVLNLLTFILTSDWLYAMAATNPRVTEAYSIAYEDEILPLYEEVVTGIQDAGTWKCIRTSSQEDTSGTSMKDNFPGSDVARNTFVAHFEHIDHEEPLLRSLVPRAENSVSAPIVSGNFGRAHVYKHLPGRVPAPINNTSSAFREAAKSLAYGFGEGFTGIVTAPAKGAAQEGIIGFGKGIVKGSLGVVVKPTTGALVFAHCSIKGICSAVGKTSNNAPTISEYAEPVIEGFSTTQEADLDTLAGEEIAFSIPELEASTPSETGSCPLPGTRTLDESSDTPEHTVRGNVTSPLERHASCQKHDCSANGHLQHPFHESNAACRAVRESVAAMTDQRYSAVIEEAQKAVRMVAGRHVDTSKI